MNADIIAATRALATSRDNICDNPTVRMLGKEVVLNTAADLIESLQNEALKYKALSESLKKECGRLMTLNDELKVRLANVTARNERLSNDYSAYGDSALERADGYIEQLEAQLSASQAREREATCDGCIEQGQWDNEVEYGCPSPCTCCARRCADNWNGPQPKEECK